MKRIFLIISLFFLSCENKQLDKPNILFIMSDDHTSQAWGIYGGILADYVKNDGIKRLEKSNELKILERLSAIEEKLERKERKRSIIKNGVHND